MDSRPSLYFLVCLAFVIFPVETHFTRFCFILSSVFRDQCTTFHRCPCSSWFGWLKSLLGFWERRMMAHKGREREKGDSWVTLSSLESSVHLENFSLFPRLAEPFHPRIMRKTEFNKFLFWLLWCCPYYFLSEDGTYGY